MNRNDTNTDIVKNKLYKAPEFSEANEEVPSLVKSIKEDTSTRQDTLCRRTVGICSKMPKSTSQRMRLILQSLIILLFGAGLTYAFYLVCAASDWFFAVEDTASRAAISALFFVLSFAVTVLVLLLFFGMLVTAHKCKDGQRMKVSDIFFVFRQAQRKKYFKVALLSALLLTFIALCFGTVAYGVDALSALVLEYYGELGRMCVTAVALPLFLTLTVFSAYPLIKIFCVFELTYRCPDDRIFDIFSASVKLSRGKEKEIGGLLLRWLACTFISLLSVGVLIPIFLMPGICIAYATGTDILIADSGKASA